MMGNDLNESGLGTARWGHRAVCMGLLLLGSVATLVSQEQSPSPSVESQFQGAMSAQDRGDLERAKSILLELRKANPGLFPVDESLGLILVAQEKYQEALPFLKDAVREQPQSDVAHSNLGADLFKLKRSEEALAEFMAAARINPNNPATQQALGEAWLNAGKPERAVEAFSKALQAKPGDSDLELALGTAMVANREFAKAQKTLEQVSGVDNSADAQILLGQAAEGQGDPLAAARHFAQAVRLDPSEPNVWTLGVEYLRHWTFDSAVIEFAAAVEKFPKSVRMKVGLGAAYFGAGKYGESIPVFAELLEGDEDNALYAELLGMSCNAVTETAKQKCGALLAYADAHPGDVNAATAAASMLLTETATSENTQHARKLLETALAHSPKTAKAHYQLGLLKQNTGDWKGSVAPLELAVKLKPDLAQAHYRLALAYWRTGQKDAAQEQMTLQKNYSQQEKDDLDRRLREITVFVVDTPK